MTNRIQIPVIVCFCVIALLPICRSFAQQQPAMLEQEVLSELDAALASGQVSQALDNSLRELALRVGEILSGYRALAKTGLQTWPTQAKIGDAAIVQRAIISRHGDRFAKMSDSALEAAVDKAIAEQLAFAAINEGLEDYTVLRAFGLSIPLDLSRDYVPFTLLTANYDSNMLIDVALAGISRGDILMVRPGVGLNDTPPESGDAFPANPGFSLGRVLVDYYRKGFGEIALLSRDGIAHCTAVIITDEWALTAAHCISIDPASLIVSRPSCASPISNHEFALFPEAADGSDEVKIAKLTSAGPEVVGTRRGSKLPAKEICVNLAWQTKNDSDRDLALIKIASIARVETIDNAILTDSTPSGLVDVTIAGYGVSSNSTLGEKLRLGWQRLDGSRPTPSLFFSDGETFALACKGDSGGPMFAGRQRGFQSEKHEILGILSMSQISGITDCSTVQTAEIKIAPLWTEENKTWIRQIISGSR